MAATWRGHVTLLIVLCPLFFAVQAGWGEEAGRTLLESRCSGCHRPYGGGGKLDSIDFQRKTPEGWQMTLSRMVRTHAVKLEAGEVRTLIKYLSDINGLAPAEIEPFRYALEKRNNTVEQEVPKAVHGTCVLCHSYARIALQRRTPEFWSRLPDSLVAFLPNLENQAASAGKLDDLWHTVVRKEAVPYLTAQYPFDSAEWKKWQATPKLDYAGVWKVVGHDPGRGGDYTGQLTLKALGEDQYEGEFSHEFSDGSKETGKTTGIVYTGFQWRGVAQSEGNKRSQEIFFANEDGSVISGRRLLTNIGDIGREEKLYRNDSVAKLLAVVPAALKAGTTQEVKFFGTSLPQDLDAAALSLGEGVTVQSVRRQGEDTVVAQVTTEKGAKVGPRRANLQGAEGVVPLAVYRTVDYIRISPEQAFSRPGGVRTPKRLQQFEVVGYLNGVDGKKGTQDDIQLGRVGPIRWNLEEYVKRVNDDDMRFVGAVDEDGLFTPANDGPNPQRPLSEANVGDVWVEAWYMPDGARRPIGARAYLLVMPPKYNFQPIE
jgi:quinohemoprotein amine dehydrogenase